MSQTKAQLLGPLVADDITVTGTINFDSGTFKVDSTADKVGIGTGANAPTKTLDVGGDTQIADLYYTADYPTVRPTIDLAFDKVKKLDNRITFRRESIGTFVNSDGYIETAGHNKPRFNHDPITRESLGLLIEESRTNILKGTSTAGNFTSSNGYWTIGGNRATQGSDQLAPDGTLSAFSNAYNGTSGDANIYYSDAGNNAGGEVPTSNSTVYTLSVFAKVPSGNNYIQGIRLRTYNSNNSASFNLKTGTIIGTAEGTTTNRMEAYPNGWYRCSITFTSGTDGNQGVQFYLLNEFNTATLNDPSANGEALYYWAPQLEEGSFPTSYIPTSGSAVTRQADGAAFEGTNLTDWYNQSEGTWIIDTNKTESIDGGYSALFYMRPVSSSTANTRNEMYKLSGSGRIAFNYDENSGDPSTVNLSTTDVISSGDNTIFAFYKVNDYGLGFNGTIKTTGDNGAVQINTDPDIYLAIGSTFDPSSGGSSEHWNGHFRRFTYYPYRLNNSQIANLTL